MITSNEYYRKWYDAIAPKEPVKLITQLKIQGLWYPPDVCGTVQNNICSTITEMVRISRQTGNETGAQVCRNMVNESIVTGPIVTGQHETVSIPLNSCPANYQPLGTLHTHPPYEHLNGIPDHYPSPTDLEGSIYAGTHSNCIISESDGQGQCYTIRTAKALHDAYSIAQGMTLDLEYHGKIAPETKGHMQTFIDQFGCMLSCR